MFNLFKTYNKAKDVFVKPKLKLTFGLWKNTPGLPFWRVGNRIKIAKFNQFYYPQNSVRIKEYDIGDIKPDGTIAKYKTYKYIKHTLPKGANNGVWNRNIRKKLRKYYLGWLKPQYFLPLWLSFYVFDWDVCYKWKYDDIRYEFPPQFTFVFFGFALTIFVIPIMEDEDDSPDHYWESLLSYLYQDKCNKDVSKTLTFCGKWSMTKNGKETSYFQLRKSHIKQKYHEEYDMAVLNYNKNKYINYDNY